MNLFWFMRKFTPNQFFISMFLPALPKAKAGLGVQSLRPSVRPFVCPSVPKSCHRNSSETWYVDRTSYVFMHIGRKF